ncbi:MAG TPA: bifunctional DNA-formamidopyrimidine glycosylase/DNA-(apurinic or apyrimidinic site) lyase [Candidatus Woesebacteria bacterium]|nr:bifunctional DNA-formamidopyrimidine glycosylase/DNA-(apurinic or apyrimidinic site) lyase [Candidatus Woesebacteria bacterium]
MPELPEVETICTRLKPIIVGKTIAKIEVLREKSFHGEINRIIGQPVLDVVRRAKLIRVMLDHSLNLVIHLKMTGQLIFQDDQVKIGGGHPTADWIHQLPSSHTRVVIHFRDNSKLFFNDLRVFGWIRIMSDSDVSQLFSVFGPDANSQELTANYLGLALQSRTISIKQAIMNNEIIAGVGNIYAVEALFMAGIHPLRQANSLTKNELVKLIESIRMVIQAGIDHQGTTFDGQYVAIDGLSGQHQHFLSVYGKKDGICPSCAGPISKIKIGGRGTYLCEKCQH